MTTKKRFMSILLSLVMVLGLVPGIGMTAYAAGEKAYTAYDVTTDANKEKSGNDLTDLQVTFNGKKWYIIEDNSTAVNAGTVTLLAAESFGGSKFHDNSNKYSTSTIKTTLDNMTVSDGSFADVASAIDTVKVKGSESDAEVDAKLYLLSEGEAGPLPVNVKQFSNFWWLRSPNPDGGSSARCVDSSSGDVQNADVDAVWILVRPALKLNLSSVIFSSESNSFTLKPAHTHSFSYSASGATITATCTAEECTLTSNPTLTIVAPTLTYVGQTGTDISASATLDGLDAFNAATGANLAVTNIKYVGRDGTTYEESETAPTAGGKYTAKITLSGVKTSEGENKSVTASVDYSIKVTLTFNSNGGSEIARQVLDVDECPTEPAEPTNGAYYFGGWYEDEIFENGFAFQPITQNKTVYAKWGEHEVKWVIGGYFRREVFTGAVPAADSSSEVNTILSLLIDDMGPLSGATFIEWKTVTDQIGNVTHTAQLSFPVTLHANEGTISAGDISSYMVGTGVTLPTDVTREGYRFGGWYDNSECTGTAVTQISATNTGSKEYWAKWDAPISRTVTFKVVNGKWDDETTADKTVPLNGYEGDTLKLTADQIPEVGSYPNTGYKAGSWDVTPSTDTAITNATTYTYTYAQKEKAVVAKAPTGKKLSHSGQSKELVTAGEATGGTMYYALGEDETTAPATSAFSEAVPTGTDIGTYYVWYIAKGDENHQDSTPACVIATISENEGKASFVNKDNSSNITGVDQDVIRDQMQEIAEADATDPQEGQTKSVTVTLETKAVPADEVPQEEKKAIDKEMKTSIPDTYAETVQSDFLEISVDKIVIIYENSSNGDKEEKSNIKSSLKELPDVVDIPVRYNMTNKHNPTIVRYHGGEAQTFRRLTSKPEARMRQDATFYIEGAGENAVIHIYTKYFSTYALLTYGEEELKDMAKVVTPPTARTLTDTGYAQKLVTAGTTEDGTMQYALGKNAVTVPEATAFSTSIPTGKDVGTYNVWYKVKADDTHIDSNSVCVTVKISQKSAEEEEPEKPAEVKTVAMYRLYNPFNREHLYTESENEKNVLSTKYGWKYEGIAWYAPEKSNTPVYRLYNPVLRDHHYTTDKHEKDVLSTKYGWKYEGIGWYSDDNKTVPIYRVFCPFITSGSHHFTAGKNEVKHLISVGWIDEKIGWYGVKEK